MVQTFANLCATTFPGAAGAIVGLAVKGYLKIVEQKIEGFISLLDKIDYELVKQKEADVALDSFERKLQGDLFEAGKERVMLSEMKNKFYKNIPELKKNLMQGLMDKKYFKQKPDIKKAWPWFIKVLKAESESYFAQKHIEEGEKWKKIPIAHSWKDIIAGIGGSK